MTTTYGEGYVRNKLRDAVEALATGEGTIQMRIVVAYKAMFVLYHGNVLENSQRQAALDAIFTKVVEKVDPQYGPEPFVLRWRRKTAAAVAQQIVALHDALCDDRLQRLESDMRTAGLQPHMDW